MRYKYSVRDLYMYDNTIFDNLTIPSVLDKDTVIRRILKETSRFALIDIYSDPEVLKADMTYFSEDYARRWEKLAEIYAYDYDVGHNYDMSEVEAFDGKTTNDSTNTGKVTTYDSDTFHDNDKSILDGEGTNNWTRTLDKGGNLGVTMIQQMFEKDTEFWNKTNIYHEITKDFMREYCIMTY